MDIDVLGYALFYLCLVFSFTIHEAAHAITAAALGDDTPVAQGRITLNPIAHLDLFGSVILPIMLLVTSGSAIGWAKPVQIDPGNFKNKRRDEVLVTMAGPASNLMIAVLCIFVGRIAILTIGVNEYTRLFFWSLQIMLHLNLLLMVFNLLPVPPLDGHHLLPKRVKEAMRAMGPFTLLIGIFLVWPYIYQAISPALELASWLMLGT